LSRRRAATPLFFVSENIINTEAVFPKTKATMKRAMADFNDCPCYRCGEPEGKAARGEIIAAIVAEVYAAHHAGAQLDDMVPRSIPLDATGQLFPVACCRRRLHVVARDAP
jgi:hypothetical protein